MWVERRKRGREVVREGLYKSQWGQANGDDVQITFTCGARSLVEVSGERAQNGSRLLTARVESERRCCIPPGTSVGGIAHTIYMVESTSLRDVPMFCRFRGYCRTSARCRISFSDYRAWTPAVHTKSKEQKLRE